MTDPGDWARWLDYFPTNEVLARSRTTVVARAAVGESESAGDGAGAARAVIVKRYEVVGLRGLWRRFGSRPLSCRTHAWHEGRALRALAALGLGPAVFATIEKRRFGFLPWRGIIVMEDLAGYLPLPALGLCDSRPSCGAALAETLGDAVRRMHDAGFEHRDLHPRNVLVRFDARSAAYDPRFIDCRKARLGRRPLPPAVRARDRAPLRAWLEKTLGDPAAARFDAVGGATAGVKASG
ncbi:MAG: hypothetical protein HY719_17205 [Planctomycetes bacterium]|nr:hypothetical protein [Planctomycetota bacterium]